MKGIENNLTKNTYESAPENWKQFFVEFKNLRKDVPDHIFSLDGQEMDELLKEIKNKEKASFSSIPNPEKYLTYHLSIGGSVGPKDAPHLDFEGEHSIMEFYKNLESRFK
jgi:hypothetical protein